MINTNNPMVHTPYTDDAVLAELWKTKDARAAKYANATNMLAALKAKYEQPTQSTPNLYSLSI